MIENVRMAGRSHDEVGGVGDEMETVRKVGKSDDGMGGVVNARDVKEVRNAHGAYAEEGEMVKDVIEVEDEHD